MMDVQNLLPTLWQMTWQASAIALLVLCLRKVTAKLLSNRWRNALWFLVLVRLFVPTLPQSRYSLFSLDRSSSGVAEPSESSNGQWIVTVEKRMRGDSPSLFPPETPSLRNEKSHVAWSQIITYAWLATAALLLTARVIANFLFSLKLRRGCQSPDPHLDDLFQQTRQAFHLLPPVRLRVTALVDAPAVAGALWPRVLIPHSIANERSENELRLIFLHELAHVARFDPAIDWLWAFAQSLHWFNPILWLITPVRKIDHELARDEMVLTLAGDSQSEPYGQLLIHLAQPLRLPIFCTGLLGMSANKFRLCSRIKFIASFTPTRWPSTTIGVALLAIAASCTLTKPMTVNANPPVTSAPTATFVVVNGENDLDTRRYDVTNLLFVPLDDVPPDSPSSRTFVTGPDASSRINDIRQYIIDNVEPDSWQVNGGKAGTISPSALQSVLLITQTPHAHRKIVAALDDLQHVTSTQVSIETRAIALSREAEKTLPASLQSRLALVRNAGRARRDVFLNDTEVNQLIRSIGVDSMSTSLKPPRLTMFSGQKAYIQINTQLAYAGDMSTTGQSIVRNTTKTNMQISVAACPSPDGQCIFVTLDSEWDKLLELIDEPFGKSISNLQIKKPVIRKFKISTAACAIPMNSTVLLGGIDTVDMDAPEINENSPARPATLARMQSLEATDAAFHKYFLVKPYILHLLATTKPVN